MGCRLMRCCRVDDSCDAETQAAVSVVVWLERTSCVLLDRRIECEHLPSPLMLSREIRKALN